MRGAHDVMNKKHKLKKIIDIIMHNSLPLFSRKMTPWSKKIKNAMKSIIMHNSLPYVLIVFKDKIHRRSLHDFFKILSIWQAYVEHAMA